MGKRKGAIAESGKYSLRTHRGKFVVEFIGEDGKRCRLSLRVNTSEGNPAGINAFNKFIVGNKSIQETKSLKIGDIFKMYAADREADGINTNEFWVNWKALAPTFSDLEPFDLQAPIDVEGQSRTVCHRYAIDRTKAGRARDTVWTELTRLRSCINWAAKKNVIDKDKKPYVWVPTKGKPRDKTLTAAECRHLMKEAETPHIKLFIIIALNTGARTAAILELTWDRVDFEANEIRLEVDREDDILSKKFYKGRATVQMNEFLAATLNEYRKASLSNYVIEFNGKPIQSIKKAFRRAAIKAGLPEATPHVLRHTAATIAFEEMIFSETDSEVGFAKISRMLGHKDIETTKHIYIKYQTKLTEGPTRALGKMFLEG